MVARSMLAAIASVAVASAQGDWGTYGVWEQVIPSNQGPSASYFHHAATTAGSFYITGGDITTNNNATFQYDPVTNIWTKFPDLSYGFVAPALITSGGFIMQVGGLNNFGYSNTLQIISSSNAANGWQTVTLPNAPAPRNGHRVLFTGGYLLLTGGWDATTYYNDVWGLDVDSIFQNATMANGQPAQWVQLIAQNTPGMFPPRNSFSWDMVGSTNVIFGGFFHNVNNVGPWTDCTNPSAQCVFYNDIWIWRPGNPQGLAPLVGTGGWTQLTSATGQNGGPLPIGRYGHGSGILSDQLYIFGGFTQANGQLTALNDLWAFNMVVQQWAPVVQTTPWPSPRGWNAAVFIGRHMYIYGGDGTSQDLWRWAPTFYPSGGLPGSQSQTVSLTGVTAGLVISCLVGIATLGMLIYSIRKSAGGIGFHFSTAPSVNQGDVYDKL